MEISWLGHSCIRVRSQNVTLIAEPYAASVGTSMGRQSAEVITVSHDHPHHSYAEGVQGSPRVLRGPGEYEIANLYITVIASSVIEPQPLWKTSYSNPITVFAPLTQVL